MLEDSHEEYDIVAGLLGCVTTFLKDIFLLICCKYIRAVLQCGWAWCTTDRCIISKHGAAPGGNGLWDALKTHDFSAHLIGTRQYLYFQQQSRSNSKRHAFLDNLVTVLRRMGLCKPRLHDRSVMLLKRSQMACHHGFPLGGRLAKLSRIWRGLVEGPLATGRLAILNHMMETLSLVLFQGHSRPWSHHVSLQCQ